MKADALISELKRKFSISTDRELASRLGMTAIQIGNWKRRKKALTPRQVANAIEKASHAAVNKAHRSMRLYLLTPDTVNVPDLAGPAYHHTHRVRIIHVSGISDAQELVGRLCPRGP